MGKVFVKMLGEKKQKIFVYRMILSVLEKYPEKKRLNGNKVVTVVRDSGN